MMSLVVIRFRMIKNLYICMQQYYGSIGTNLPEQDEISSVQFAELGLEKLWMGFKSRV